MHTITWIIIAILALMLLGQYLAGTADYFLSIDSPRPLDESIVTITIFAWGFASQSSRSCVAEFVGEGFADMRLFATRKQVVLCLITFGFVRRVSVVWRGNAGQHPLGVA